MVSPGIQMLGDTGGHRGAVTADNQSVDQAIVSPPVRSASV
jgi:hypothetical protein